jgi:putative FmdB family regulatory protein
MPTYDYECDACGYRFEEWQSFKDEPLTECPKCQKKALRRLFGRGAAIIFKGSGFYETDYRSESYKQAEKADREAQSKAESQAAATTCPVANSQAAPAAASPSSPASASAPGSS